MEAFIVKGGRARILPCPTKHRMMVASIPLGMGDLVLENEPVALARVEPTHCAFCLAPNAPLRCSSCKRSSYCNRQCQRRDFKTGHSLVCGFLKDDDADGEMVVKVSASPLFPEFLAADLMGHPLPTSASPRLERLSRLSGLQIAEVERLLQIFACNNFTVTDSNLFGISEAAYTWGSLFNHSCSPNCIVVYHGKVQRIYAARTIYPNEELCISYVDPMSLSRKETLKQRYKFTCTCIRCLAIDISGNAFSIIDGLFHEEPTHGQVSSLSEFASRVLDLMLPAGIYSSGKEVRDRTRYQLVKSLINSGSAPSYQQFRKAVLTQRDAVESEEWGRALEPCLFVLAVYLLVYDGGDLVLGHHALLTSKVVWNSGSNDMALMGKLLALARGILAVGGEMGEVEQLERLAAFS